MKLKHPSRSYHSMWRHSKVQQWIKYSIKYDIPRQLHTLSLPSQAPFIRILYMLLNRKIFRFFKRQSARVLASRVMRNFSGISEEIDKSTSFGKVCFVSVKSAASFFTAITSWLSRKFGDSRFDVTLSLDTQAFQEKLHTKSIFCAARILRHSSNFQSTVSFIFHPADCLTINKEIKKALLALVCTFCFHPLKCRVVCQVSSFLLLYCFPLFLPLKIKVSVNDTKTKQDTQLRPS